MQFLTTPNGGTDTPKYGRERMKDCVHRRLLSKELNKIVIERDWMISSFETFPQFSGIKVVKCRNQYKYMYEESHIGSLPDLVQKGILRKDSVQSRDNFFVSRRRNLSEDQYKTSLKMRHAAMLENFHSSWAIILLVFCLESA